jgi:hypothetical protein
MDPLTGIKSLFGLAILLRTWLEERKEKDSTVKAISSHISRICTLMEPFQGANNLDPSIQHGFLAIGDVLARTKEHLLVWGNKRSYSLGSVLDFLDPASVTKKLKEDEQQLSQQLVVMLFSIAVIGYFRDRSPMSEKDKNTFVFGSVRNKEVMEFWQRYIGARVNVF